MSMMIEVDNRSRVTLPGKAGRKYLMREGENGAVILEPAVVMSEMELRALRDPQLQTALANDDAHPELRSPRPARRTA